MRRAIVAAFIACCAASGRAEPVTYLFDAQHTQVQWETRHFGTSTQRGRFVSVEGSIVIDWQAGRGDVSVSIATADVSSGVPALDAMLRGAGFLASDRFPAAYFVARQLRFEGDRLQEVRGEFTLRGVSQPLSLRATRFACRLDAGLRRDVCGGDFEGRILRSDFGSTYGLPFVGDEVRLLVAVEAVRQP